MTPDGGIAEFGKSPYDFDPPPGVIRTIITPLDIKYTYPRLCYTDDFNRWCDRLELTPITPKVVYDSVTSGLQFSCGLTRSQDVYCWGLNDMNQLGGAITPHCSIYGRCSFKPQLVVGGHKFVQIKAIGYHTCGVDVNGDAWCWGQNLYGELGVPTTGAYSIAVPQLVSGGHKFVSVGAGWYHSCGLTAAGEVWCWGDNEWGQIGDNSTVDNSLPQRTFGSFTYTSLSVGGLHSCAIDVTQSVLCWGMNAWLQLGIGNLNLNTCRFFDPTLNFCSTVPTSRSYGQTQFNSVSAGLEQTCAITVANLEQCWGSNGFGQLGDGTYTRRGTATAVAGSLTFSATSTAYDHTCSRRVGSFGVLFCWGENLSGQLGDGAPVSNGQVNAGSPTPIQVVGGHDFTQVAVGSLGHTCGVTRGGSVYCWGRNYEGALGTNTVATVTAVPRRIQEP
jgi:alpha-tubulin suppressor-like RCC1 family protein